MGAIRVPLRGRSWTKILILSSCACAVLIVGVMTSSVAVPATGLTALTLPSHPEDAVTDSTFSAHVSATRTPSSLNSSACAIWGNVSNGTAVGGNSTAAWLFQDVCHTPQFYTLYEVLGIYDFTWGYSESAGSLAMVTFSFEWVSNCSNSTTGFTGRCGNQEYWIGNVTTNTTRGPYVTQTPYYTYGGLRQAPIVPPAVEWLLASLASVSIVAVLALIYRSSWASRARRLDADDEEENSSQDSEVSGDVSLMSGPNPAPELPDGSLPRSGDQLDDIV
jgi:hypothetical protein